MSTSTVQRHRWNFIEHPERPSLTALEVNYWKSLLNKLIKVGAEIEFNLSSGKGLCKSYNIACGCKYLTTHTCWTRCAVGAMVCSTRKHKDTCENKKEACSQEMCDSCKDYKFKCLELSCSMFVPPCTNCADFTMSCSSCNLFYDSKKNPEYIRSYMKQVLKPNNCYGTINGSGVHSIKTDGSLLGDKGAEIITIGRRVDFWEFHKMFSNIISTAVQNGAYVNERCSVHMHVLTSYYENSVESQNNKQVPNRINELEKPMPELILANFHQLIRKYQNAITWMAMGLDNPQHMTRWEKYRVSVLNISPVLSSMQEVVEMVYKQAGNMKYGFVDYRFCTFSDLDIKKFHVEIRALDPIICPSVLSAFACLYHAILIKAVEISRWGLLELDFDSVERMNNMKSVILNGCGGWDSDRLSNTREIMKYENEFIEDATDLIQQLKHILLLTGPAYDVLESIAKRPVAFRRIEGQDWEQIENDLKPTLKGEETALEKVVDELIDSRAVRRCETPKVWVEEVAKVIVEDALVELGGTVTEEIAALSEEINKIVDNKCREGMAIWSDSIGSIVGL